MSVVCRLGMAAEFRDEDTGNHVIRVGCYSRAVAAEMGMPRSFLEMLLLAAPLHDIGKIGIPDSVLLKPGPLTDEEWVDHAAALRDRREHPPRAVEGDGAVVRLVRRSSRRR